MRRILASAAAIALVAGTAGTAFAKDHLDPKPGPHEFGQDRADESYVIGGETARPDAKGTDGSEKGIDDGTKQATKAQMADRDPASPTRGKPE